MGPSRTSPFPQSGIRYASLQRWPSPPFSYGHCGARYGPYAHEAYGPYDHGDVCTHKLTDMVFNVDNDHDGFDEDLVTQAFGLYGSRLSCTMYENSLKSILECLSAHESTCTQVIPDKEENEV